MKFVKPCFYDSFKCTAGKCSDTCCIGWEIDIDADTYELYKSLQGDFGKRLMDNIAFDGETASFKLLKGDICPFLNNEGLCDIYINSGRDYLCDICSLHPRFFNFSDDRTEAGLGLCCEEACRLLIESGNRLTFITEDDGKEAFINTPVEDMLLNARENIFNIIYNREKPLKKRISDIFKFSLKAQKDIFPDNNITPKGFSQKPFPDIIKDIIKLMLNTEPVNGEWIEYINKIEKNADAVLSSLNSFVPDDIVYEQLFTYLIYRYFLKSAENEDIISVIKFALINLIFIYLSDAYSFLLNKKITLNDRISNIKRWSKQIEYSQENIDLIFYHLNDIL